MLAAQLGQRWVASEPIAEGSAAAFGQVIEPPLETVYP